MNKKMISVFTTVFTSFMKRDYEYAPGIVVRVVPENLDHTCFYPFNQKAEKVCLVLTDGERFMDKFIFENLYEVSKKTNLFSKEDKHPLPFTVEEFDHFHRFLVMDYVAHKAAFPAYIKITNFLVPVSESLYYVETIFPELLENLDLDLELLPYELVTLISQRCDLTKVAHRRDLVKHFLEEPDHIFGYYTRRSVSQIMEYVDKIKPLVEEMGHNFKKTRKMFYNLVKN